MICGSAPVVEYARRSTNDSRSYGQTVVYQCNPGFETKDSTTVEVLTALYAFFADSV